MQGGGPGAEVFGVLLPYPGKAPFVVELDLPEAELFPGAASDPFHLMLDDMQRALSDLYPDDPPLAMMKIVRSSSLCMPCH